MYNSHELAPNCLEELWLWLFQSVSIHLSEMYTIGSHEVVTTVNHIGRVICLEHLHALITILIVGASV